MWILLFLLSARSCLQKILHPTFEWLKIYRENVCPSNLFKISNFRMNLFLLIWCSCNVQENSLNLFKLQLSIWLLVKEIWKHFQLCMNENLGKRCVLNRLFKLFYLGRVSCMSAFLSLLLTLTSNHIDSLFLFKNPCMLLHIMKDTLNLVKDLNLLNWRKNGEIVSLIRHKSLEMRILLDYLFIY